MTIKQMTCKLFPLLLLLLSGGLWAQENVATAGLSSKSIEMIRLDEEPVIDGVLDDDVWQQAILVFNYGAQDRDKDNNFTSTGSDLSLRATYTFRY